MRDGYHQLRSLPGVSPAQIDLALLRDDVVHSGPRRCHDISSREHRQDVAAKVAVPVFVSAGHRQEGFPSGGDHRPFHKIHLAARSADLPRSRTFGDYLSIQVGADTPVDRQDIGILSDDGRFVDVIDVVTLDRGIASNPVI